MTSSRKPVRPLLRTAKNEGRPGGLLLAKQRPALLRRRIYPTTLKTGKTSGGGHERPRTSTAGNLAPFAALLRTAEIVHVGKGATFGLGRVEIADAESFEEGVQSSAFQGIGKTHA